MYGLQLDLQNPHVKISVAELHASEHREDELPGGDEHDDDDDLRKASGAGHKVQGFQDIDWYLGRAPREVGQHFGCIQLWSPSILAHFRRFPR